MRAPDDPGSVPTFERVRGLRVVADPSALDSARWVAASEGPVTLLRVAPDEIIALGAHAAEIDDVHAIVVEEHGLVAARCRTGELEHRLEWQLLPERPSFAQGAIAGVPAKLVLRDDETVDVYTWAAYARDLATKLGWRS